MAFTLAGCSIKNTKRINAYPQEITPASTDVKSPDSLTAMLRFSSTKTGFKGRAYLTIKSPDLLRVEIYGALGQILTVVAGDSDNCNVYAKGDVRKCEWDEPVLSGLITPADLVPILLGKGTMAFKDSVQRQSSSDNFGRLTQIIARREAVSDVRSDETIRITIGDYRIVQGFRTPFRFLIQNKKEELRLEYYSLTPNPPIQHSIFTIGKTEG